MEGFTLSLALVDMIPCLFFGGTMILLSKPVGGVLFLIGAILSTLAGLSKVAWKLVLGIANKNKPWIKKGFVPLMSAGWICMIIALILHRQNVSFAGILAAITSLPALIFYLLFLAFFAAFIIYWRTKFDGSAKSNWVEEILNSCSQASLFIAVLLSVL